MVDAVLYMVEHWTVSSSFGFLGFVPLCSYNPPYKAEPSTADNRVKCISRHLNHLSKAKISPQTGSTKP